MGAYRGGTKQAGFTDALMSNRVTIKKEGTPCVPSSVLGSCYNFEPLVKTELDSNLNILILTFF